MADYVRQKLFVSGKKEDVRKFVSENFSGRTIDFDKSVPMNDDLKRHSDLFNEAEKIRQDNIEKYAANGWYDFRIKFWGCAYNAVNPLDKTDIAVKTTSPSEMKKIKRLGTDLFVHGTSFQTPWSNPKAWLETVSKKYKGLTFLTSGYLMPHSPKTSCFRIALRNGKYLMEDYATGLVDWKSFPKIVKELSKQG